MAQVLEGHEVMIPCFRRPRRASASLLADGDAGLCRMDDTRSAAATDLAVAVGITEEPAGLDEAERGRCRQLRRFCARDCRLCAIAILKRPLADRARPSRPCLAVAARRDAAQGDRTFSSVIGLMERHPGFRFNQSTAQLYAFLEADDPALFQQIKQKVAWQWEPIGGMWVEPDLNMPTANPSSASCFMASAFERTFGRRHTVCWLPDCFGFSPALPQILRLAGIDSFFTIKVNWSETNEMPFDLFCGRVSTAAGCLRTPSRTRPAATTVRPTW